MPWQGMSASVMLAPNANDARTASFWALSAPETSRVSSASA